MRTVSAAVVLLAGACSSRPVLPALAELRMQTFHPAVRDAIEERLQQVQASPEDAIANGRAGMVLHAHEQFAAARIMYERARALDPREFAWPYYLSAVESSLGNAAAASAVLDAALRIYPGYRPLRSRRAGILLDLGKLEESGAIYSELVREPSAPATAWFGLGRVRLAQGAASAAIEPLRNACRLYPAFGAAHYSLAQALRNAGRGQEAQHHLEQAVIHEANAPPVEDRLMAEIAELNRGPAHLLRAAKTAEEQGRTDEAEALTLQAVELDPKSVQAHTNLISLYGRRGEQEKAATHYRLVLALSPNHADAHYNYGVLLFQQKKRREARSAFEKALAANPYLAAAHNNLAYLLETDGRAAEAMKHYRLALKNEPRYRLAHFHLGRLLAERRQYAESIEHLRQTLSPEDSNTPGYLYALGDVYRRSGDGTRSTETLRQAREMAAGMGQSELAARIDKDLREPGAR